MPEPSLDSLHVNVPLSNLATGMVSKLTDFVGLQIAPPFPVDKISDSIWELDARSFMRADNNAQGWDGYLPEIRWKDTTRSYRAIRHGLSRFVANTEEANADPMVKPSRTAQRILMERNLRTLEKSILTKMTTAANFTYTTTVPAGDRFNVPGASLDAYVIAAQETPDIPPNAVLMGIQTWHQIRNMEEVKDKYKFTGQGMVPEALIAEVLGLPPENIFVSRAKFDNSDEAAAQSNQYIMSKDMLFFYLDRTPARESLNTAWTFWFRSPDTPSRLAPGSANPFYVKPTEERRRAGGGVYYDCEAWYDEANIINTRAAYLLKSVID